MAIAFSESVIVFCASDDDDDDDMFLRVVIVWLLMFFPPPLERPFATMLEMMLLLVLLRFVVEKDLNARAQQVVSLPPNDDVAALNASNIEIRLIEKTNLKPQVLHN